ncbi:hypothetical protein LV716_17310 [Flagellimonas sp. HMM57]|uniref:hypothetical protein n=1 Tax=unclassified Flagellimonas TaxID=2644544 RepID=UPI0013D53E0B|nr:MULTISPECIES: hypothetical protein [unclassified Flagellimonas]UII76001.1 hypothetical protein LV716_17310 [Flagellimonas sp. HMM57]
MRLSIFQIVIFIASFANAQDDWTEVTVDEIVSTNRFVVTEVKTEKEYEIQIIKTKAVQQDNPLYEQGIIFLEKHILGKNVFFVSENKNTDSVEGSILYECQRNTDYPNNDLPPCLSATPLDYTLIKKGFVENLGNKTVSNENPE